MADGVIPSKKVYARIGTAVKHFEQTYINPGLREEKVVRARGRCERRNEIWKLKVTGDPTGGTFDIDVIIDGTQETVTIDYNASAASVKTAFATHSELVSTDLDTAGGPFPGTEITVEFIDNFAGKKMFDSVINTPIIDDSGLTGGTTPTAWIIPYQGGGPGNANP
jgi:hypothetical protein